MLQLSLASVVGYLLFCLWWDTAENVVKLELDLFKKNLNASKPSEHPPQVEECLKV